MDYFKAMLISLFIFFSCVSYAQERKDSITKVDSMDIKVISMREFEDYLERIDFITKKQFDLTEVSKYQQILKIIQSVYMEADKKRKK